MTTCIFHDTVADRRDRCLFEIVDQAYCRQERVLIFSDNDERASAIDRMLWILKQEAFIPHKIVKPGDSDNDVSVAIVVSETNPIAAPILIADGHCSLDFASTFSTIHEFVTRTTPQIHEACRERFRLYRARQLAVEHVKDA
jgi:DNA polymerase IIIc chi subunit